MINSVGIIGGDKRQKYLSELFRSSGASVHTAMNSLCGADRLTDALSASIIVLPVPLSRAGTHLNCTYAEKPIELNCLYNLLPIGGTVFGLGAEKAAEIGCVAYDYASREDFAINNALPTAEGAIALAINACDGVLCSSRCLVVGYGRIGKLLAVRLDALGAHVTVAARSAGDIATANAFGFETIRSDRLGDYDLDYECIFNTVPARLLEPVADKISRRTVIELASAPFGISGECARENSITLVNGSGLPGRTAPKYAAKVIFSTIQSIIAEECL